MIVAQLRKIKCLAHSKCQGWELTTCKQLQSVGSRKQNKYILIHTQIIHKAYVECLVY